MITKELIVAALGFIMGVLNTFVGHDIFSTDQMSQMANIVFLIVTFIAAYRHNNVKKEDPVPVTEQPIQNNSGFQLP